jgi:hypothetical protein
VPLVPLVRDGGIVVATTAWMTAPGDEARGVRTGGVFVRSDLNQLAQPVTLVGARRETGPRRPRECSCGGCGSPRTLLNCTLVGRLATSARLRRPKGCPTGRLAHPGPCQGRLRPRVCSCGGCGSPRTLHNCTLAQPAGHFGRVAAPRRLPDWPAGASGPMPRPTSPASGSSARPPRCRAG